MTGYNKAIGVMIIILLLFLTIVPLVTYADGTNLSQIPNESTARGISRNQLSGSLANDSWPAFRGDPARTGNSSATGPGSYKLLWSKAVSNLRYSSPVVMYDQIYIAYYQGIRCYNLTGTLEWTYTFSASSSQYGSPLVYNGRVYLAGSNGMLYCLDANATSAGATTLYWSYNDGGKVTSSSGSPISDGIRVYYSTRKASGLHAVWLSNGSKAWSASLGGSTTTESSPAYWNGRVYCGASDSYNMSSGNHSMFCFNATNGNMIWTFHTQGGICSTPAIAYQRVYFASYDHKVYCVDAIGSGSSTKLFWAYNLGVNICGSPAVAYDRVYIGDQSNTNNLHCFNAHGTGGSTTKYWSQTVVMPQNKLFGICSSPAVTKDYVFIGNRENVLQCRNRNTGALVWTNTISPSGTYGLTGSVAVYKQLLIAISDSGNFYVIGQNVDLKPPAVISTTPLNGALDVNINDNISVKFDETIKISSLTTSSLILKDSQNNNVAGAITTDMSPGMDTVYFTPDSTLNKNETYTVTVTTDVTDLQNNHLDGNKNGVAEGIGIDEYTFNFTTVPFYPPTIVNMPTLKPTEDIPYMRNLSSYISDEDTDKSCLILAEDSSYATLNGFELNLLYPDGVAEDVIHLSVNDGMYTTSKNIQVEVKSVNDPPVIAPVPAIELTEDVTQMLDIKEYITDIDTPYSELSIYDTTSSKYIEIDELTINFTYPDGVTADLINVTVYDVEDVELSDYTEIQVIVEPVNDPPVITELPPITVKEDIEFEFLLDDHISDIDTLKDELEIKLESPYVTVNNHTLYLTYPEKISNDVIEITVYDGELHDSATLSVTLEAVNDPPMIISIISPKEGDVLEHNETFDCLALVHDPDMGFGDELEFLWYDFKGSDLGETQNVTGVSLDPGEHMISFMVKDKFGDSASVNINITVNKKPVPPGPEPEPNTDKDTEPKPDSKPDPEKNPNPNNIDSVESREPSSASSDYLGLIIVIVLVVIILIVLVVIFLVKKRKKKRSESIGEAPEVLPQVHVEGQLAAQIPNQIPFQIQSPTYTDQIPPQMQYPYQTQTQEIINYMPNAQFTSEVDMVPDIEWDQEK